jgi:phytoene/squalene synthetase
MSENTPTASSPEPELARYRRHVDHFDLPDAQKDELLRTIWQMMKSFVDRVFGDDPVQHCLPHVDDRHETREPEFSSMVESGSTSTTTEQDDLPGAFQDVSVSGRDGKEK